MIYSEIDELDGLTIATFQPEICLLAKEIVETQKLLCVRQKMYDPALVSNDKAQVGKKMRLTAEKGDQQQTSEAETEEPDGPSLWDCSVEIRTNWEPFSRWVVEVKFRILVQEKFTSHFNKTTYKNNKKTCCTNYNNLGNGCHVFRIWGL